MKPHPAVAIARHPLVWAGLASICDSRRRQHARGPPRITAHPTVVMAPNASWRAFQAGGREHRWNDS